MSKWHGIVHAGVYTNSFDVGLNIKNGFPVFTTVIDANYINKQEDRFAAFKLTDEDKQELHRLARDPRIGVPPFLSIFLPFASAICHPG